MSLSEEGMSISVPLPVTTGPVSARPEIESSQPSDSVLADAGVDGPDAVASRVHFQLFADAEGQRVRWRLLSGNRREIGRSVRSYADAAECGAGIDWMRTHLVELTSRIQRNDKGGWSWELLLDAEVLVVSGRRFDRQIRCAQALSLFRELAPEATIHETVMMAQARRGAGERVRLGAMPSSQTNRTGARR